MVAPDHDGSLEFTAGHHRIEGQAKPVHSTIAELVAKQLKRVLETGTTDVLAASGRPDLAGLVSTIGAAELSSETGVAERPALLLSTAG